jgi:VanZ family protein
MPTAESHRRTIAIAIGAWLLFLVWQSLAYTTLSPGPQVCGPILGQQGARLSWVDGLANLLAYLPLGLLVAALAATVRRPVAALLVGFVSIAAFSLAMESLQACLPGRVSSWYDWAANSIGGLVGLLAVGLARVGLRVAGCSPALGRIGTSALIGPVLLCAGAWLVLSLSPWRFTFDVGAIRGNLAFLRELPEWPEIDRWRFALHLAGWSTTGVALRALAPGHRPALAGLVLAFAMSLAGQLLLVIPALSVEEIAGMGLAGLLAAILLPTVGETALARALPGLALAAIAAWQFSPGPSGMLAAGFDWLPQIGRGSMLGAIGFALLFSWLAFSLVLSLRWSAARGENIERRRILLPLAAIVVLLMMETAQRWVPGRGPDTSAPLVVGLAFLVAWVLTADRVRASGCSTSRRPAA